MSTLTDYEFNIRPDRLAWCYEHFDGGCMYCGRNPRNLLGGELALECHEIERRSHAAGRWGVRCNYLLLDRACHAGPFATMDHAAQLAIKLLRNPDDFSLVDWLEIADPDLRAPLRVTMSDIIACLDLKESLKPRRNVS